jgi:hypothetical protein
MGINGNHSRQVQGEEGRIAVLRESIRRAFPADTYTRRVTPHDDELSSELREDQAILEEDQDLFRAFKGRNWTEVPKQFLESLPDGLPLLTDEAFVAFLPAWLVCSLENIDGENEVRNFVVYNFSPRPEMVPDMTWFIKNRLQLLNPEQRRVVRSLLLEFTERGTSPFVKALAAKGVSLIDTLGAGPPLRSL